MSSAKFRADACPKCGSSNTEVVLLTNHKDDGHGGNLAYGICRSCGFQDQTLRGDDPDLLVQLARGQFNTVYTNSAEGLPTANELAHDLSDMLSALCHFVDSCRDCPVYEFPDDEPEEPYHAGYLTSNLRTVRLRCSHQSERAKLEREIQSEFPDLPIPF